MRRSWHALGVVAGMTEETYLFLPIDPQWAIAILNGKKVGVPLQETIHR
jgi:hypothetical protein